jgi:outer membrane receptor protein involved in Fe transport
MKVVHFCSIVFLLFCPRVAAQEMTVTVTGEVKDNNGMPVPYANVALYHPEDSVLVTGAVSSDAGEFSFQSEPGRYFLKVTFLSYADKVLPDIVLTDQDVSLGTIVLSSQASQLDEIVIEGERSTMELQLDKRVFNVGKDLTNISGSAADVLGNVPSVNVDVEGNVSLRGSQNVRILIDGKPSGLTGISTADALRQVQANLVESVEVITNPSSRYDAEGEVGIINIILKKEHRKGVNGAFTLNAGYPANHGGSFNVNLRKERINLFSSYGFNFREGPGSGSSFQRFTLPDTTFAYEQENRRVRGGTSHNFIGGMDYYFNETSVLTGSAVYRRSDGLNTSRLIFRDLDASNQVLRTVIRNEREEEPENNGEIALSYRKDFSKPGQKLTADVKWIENVENEFSLFDEQSDGQTSYQRSFNTENERNAFFQTDYIEPFGKEGKFETGVRGTLRVIENDFLVEEQNGDGVWKVNPSFDNSLLYTENILAAYTMASQTRNRLSYQAGLRAELTDISVALKRSDEVNYQNYLNLFPSTFLSYKLSEKHTGQLSYSYRISRPRFRQLLPFSSYSNNRSLRTGNPNLRPEFTHSIEASHLFNWDEGSLLSGIYYRRRQGVIEEITVVDSVGYNRVFPINLSRENAYGFEFNLSWTPAKWFRYTANANLYRAISEGEYEEQVFSRDTYTMNGRSIVQVTFLKEYDFQGTFNYQAPQNTPQGRRLSMYYIDVALARDLMKGNATLALSLRDMMNTRRFRNEIIGSELNSTSDFQWRARQLMLTFTYRLNQKKQDGNRDRGEDFDDES